jgi:hypothetical protein
MKSAIIGRLSIAALAKKQFISLAAYHVLHASGLAEKEITSSTSLE